MTDADIRPGVPGVEELVAALDARTRELEWEAAERRRLERLVAEQQAALRTLPESAAAHALRDSEERLRLLVEHVGDAVFMLDNDGKVMTWTPAAERVLGYRAEEALSLRVDDFYVPEERERAAPTAELTTALSRGRAELEGWRVAKSGQRLWAHVVTCPIVGPSGEVRGFAQIVQDRTALRATELELARHARELERSNRDLEVFASVASHDLQEPLRKLRMFGDRLKQRLPALSDPEAAQLVERMNGAAERLQTLIEELLQYSRVASEVRPLARVDLNVLARQAVEELSGAVERTGARIEVEALPSIPADAARMRQVFSNLISNALKFARPGVPPRVTIRAQPAGDELWAVRVEDNGIGFDQRYAERIFGLFQRLHGRAEYPGSGIGLAICRRVVEHHGGTIEAEGRPGAGAAFTMLLPARPAGAMESAT